MEFVYCFGFKIFSDNLALIVLNDKSKLLSTISPNSYGISTKDKEFREALKSSDYLVLDGVYFALASILLNKKNIKKNQGPDVFQHLMERMNNNNGRVFFIGSTNDVLRKMKMRANLEYPNVLIDYYSPPYKLKLSEEDNQIIIGKVNIFNPDIVFVGMTCPKQEKWSYNNKDQLNTKLICSVGAVFDWYGGNEKTIKPIWWKLRLAWLKRTINRPEIIKRYPNIFIFFWHLFLSLIRLKQKIND